MPESISVDPNNHWFSIDRDFLIDIVNMRLIRYFGSSNSVSIWNDIKTLGVLCFSDPQLKSISFGSESKLTRIEELCFSFCSLKRICIPDNIEILRARCFQNAKLEQLIFGRESRLTRIEKLCFSGCPLKSICIPRNVDFIDGSAFVDCKCQSITVDPNNHRFLIDRDFLIDNTDMRLIQYFGSSNQVHIWDNIEILGKSRFAGSFAVDSITFGSKPRLK
jgi:hypothetical protein